MKKGSLVLVIVLISTALCATLVFAIPAPTEKAGKDIDKVVKSLPNGVGMMLDDSYGTAFPGVSFADLVPSDGYRVYTLDPEKIVAADEKTERIDSLICETAEKEYLYYLKAETVPVILVAMMEENGRVSMKEAGGFAGCYAETRALLNQFTKESEIRIYNYWFGQYVLTAEIEGKRYAVPFDASQHLLKEYQGITDYHQLPTEKEFLEAMIAENERVKEEHRKYVEKYGEDAILFGSYQVLPEAHNVE